MKSINSVEAHPSAQAEGWRWGGEVKQTAAGRYQPTLTATGEWACTREGGPGRLGPNFPDDESELLFLIIFLHIFLFCNKVFLALDDSAKFVTLFPRCKPRYHCLPSNLPK